MRLTCTPLNVNRTISRRHRLSTANMPTYTLSHTAVYRCTVCASSNSLICNARAPFTSTTNDFYLSLYSVIALRHQHFSLLASTFVRNIVRTTRQAPISSLSESPSTHNAHTHTHRITYRTYAVCRLPFNGPCSIALQSLPVLSTHRNST